MNSLIRRLATCTFSVYLAFVFLVVEPAHHHEDHEDHYDCSFCLIACLSGERVSHFVLPVFCSFSIDNFTFDHFCLSSKHQMHLRSRAPPETYSPVTQILTIV